MPHTTPPPATGTAILAEIRQLTEEIREIRRAQLSRARQVAQLSEQVDRFLNAEIDAGLTDLTRAVRDLDRTIRSAFAPAEDDGAAPAPRAAVAATMEVHPCQTAHQPGRPPAR